MIKKYQQKLDLKSSLYKQRSTSPINKPTKNQFSHTHQKISLNDHRMYYNACCPNCKYLFKVTIKESMLQKLYKSQVNDRNMNSSRKNEVPNKTNTINTFTQTQKQQIIAKSSPKKQKFIEHSINKTHTSSKKFINTTPKKSSTNLANTPRKLQKNKNNQPSHMNTPQSSKNSTQYPNKSVYIMEQPLHHQNSSNQRKTSNNKQYSNKNQQISSQNYTPIRDLYGKFTKRQNQSNYISKIPEQIDKSSVKKQLSSKQVNQLLEKIYISSQLVQLLQYQSQTINSSENQLPSYYKMMLYEIQDKIKKQKQLSLM